MSKLRLRVLVSTALSMASSALFSLGAYGCNGSTGSDLVTFAAEVRGPTALSDGSYAFDTPKGYSVLLTKARIHVGAVYLNRSVPQVGLQETSCVLPGIYVGQVTQGMDVDLLSGAPTPFPVPGSGTADRAHVAEVWLNGGDIDAEEDVSFALVVAGVARRKDASIPFEGAITIGSNRKQPAENPATPGSNPICRERIVSPISVDLTPSSNGTLVLAIDPAGWFSNVDFEDLITSESEPPYRFEDTNDGQASINLYRGLHDTQKPYTLRWSHP